MSFVLSISRSINSSSPREFVFETEGEAKDFAQVHYEEWWNVHKTLFWYDMLELELVCQSAIIDCPNYKIYLKTTNRLEDYDDRTTFQN